MRTPATAQSRTIQLLAVALLAAVASCGGSSDAAADPEQSAGAVPEAERYGGTAAVGIPTEMYSMSPLELGQLYSAVVARKLLFLPLMDYEPSGEVVLGLVERWDTVRVAPDTLALTFHLRRDVKWHDGVPTTAEDVRFTYERMRDPRTAYSGSGGYRHWSPQSEVLDSFTIRFRLRPHAWFLDFRPVLPKHILQDVPPQEMRNHPWSTTRPVGNGPFRFVRHVPGQEWVFEANPDYPEALGGRPYLDRIVIRVMPDATSRLTEILVGDLDLAELTPAQPPQVETTPNVRLIAFPTGQWVYAGWNLRLPMFRDARVRRALTMALDRQQIVDALSELSERQAVHPHTRADTHRCRSTASSVSVLTLPECARAQTHLPASVRTCEGLRSHRKRERGGRTRDASSRLYVARAVTG